MSVKDLRKNTYQAEYVRIKIWLFLNFLLYITIECVSSLHVLDRMGFLIKHIDIFLMNYVILLLITCPCLLFKKVTFVFNIFAVGILGMTYMSRILMLIRGMPLRWSDFFIAKEGLSIANKYVSRDLIILIGILLVLGLCLLTISYSHQVKINHPLLIICFMMTMISLNLTFLVKASQYEEPQSKNSLDYGEEGALYSFITSYESTKTIIPKDYNKDTLTALEKKLASAHTPVSTSNNPNIIFLQVESFVDPLSLPGVTFNKDPIPNIRPYMSSEKSGLLQVPGINTARTEFEILTGVNIARLFKYEVPYTSDLLDERAIESVPQLLKKHHYYHTTAIHNHEASFYERDKVYSRLGFDHFIAIEDMDGIQYTKNWPKDHVLLSYIEQTLINTPQRDFIFTVTVGTHSSYEYDYEEKNSDIVITGPEQNICNQLQDYIDRLAETDQFLGDVIRMVHNLKEPTVLVVYSDHIPALDVITYDENYDKDLVPYFVVSNEPLTGDLDPVIPAYQLYTQIFNMTGHKGGIVSSAHQVLKEELNYQEQLDLISYDLLMGEGYITNGKLAYKPSKLRLGMPSKRVVSY